MIYIAHRGLSGIFPENTLLAFEEAYKAGARFIEFDVCLSKDKIPIIIHDDTLDRTTNFHGKVKATLFSRLSELDAGIWKKTKFTNCKIPSLESVLHWAKFNKNLTLNIELKSSAYSKSMNESSIEYQTNNLIQKYQLNSRVFVSSFQSKILTRLKEINPFLPLSILPDYDTILSGKIFSLIKELKPYSINLPYEIFTKKFQSRLSKSESDNLFSFMKFSNKEKFFVYTINTKKEKVSLEKYLISGIFTDHVNRFLEGKK